ncbi:uncharacterized protein LOC133206349, partial [Saccostrea echinata]|uniref:uncharacterized protein LOC133206349 n=1 Tax=Saccostrea echinata TaxID=191078 RepID=UPI002A83BDBC
GNRSFCILDEPTNLSCTPINSTTLMFSWTIPANGLFTVNGYHLNLERIDNIKVENFPQVDTGSVYVENYTYYSIGKYAEYRLTMHSYTASGNDNDVTTECRTLEDAPDGGPPSVNSTRMSYTEIAVVWTEPERYHHNGILVGYKIIYHAYLSQFPQEILVSNSTFSHTITGLEYDTWYVISVLPYTVVGDGPRTSCPEKTMGPTTKAPDEVTKYYCYEAVPDVLVFSWESMPCTVYVGTIAVLFLLMLMFMCACCLKGCCSDKGNDTQNNNTTNTRDVVHFREKVKVVYAMNKFKNNRKGKGGGGEDGPDDDDGTDYNDNERGKKYGRGNPNGPDDDDDNPDDDGNDYDGGKRKGPMGIPMRRMPGRGSNNNFQDDEEDPYGDPDHRGNSGRENPRGNLFKGTGKAAATIAALKARAKKNNNTVTPMNFDDEGYCEEEDDDDNKGNVTARDIWLANKHPGKNSNPDFKKNNPRVPPAAPPVLDKRFNRNVSGVDLYLDDDDDNDDNFRHPPPAPRFQVGDDASVDMPYDGPGGGKGGYPFGADGDDAAFF